MFYFYCTVMYVDAGLSHPNKDYLLTYLLLRFGHLSLLDSVNLYNCVILDCCDVSLHVVQIHDVLK